MTLQASRAEFVRRIWDYVVPATKAGAYFFSLWLPERVLSSFGREISRSDLDKIDLGNPDICLLCFAKIHRSLSRNWRRLKPELATLVERSLDELSLWEGFDRSKIQIPESKRDVTKVRFDLADIVFAAKKPILKQELQELAVDFEGMYMWTNVDDNERRIIDAVRQHVMLRAQIDLSILIAQNIQRRAEIVDRIADRLRTELDDQYLFLRELLKNSTFWQTPDGKPYASADEVPRSFLQQMYKVVDQRLAGFKEGLEKFVLTLKEEVPSKAIVDECFEIMRRTTVPAQTTNIHITNSQVGFLNTGILRDVQSIDVSITALKSRGDMDVGDAFKKITEEVVRDETLAEADKAELLSNVKYLSEMAAHKEEARNSSVLKSVLRSVSDGISAAGPAVKAMLPLVPLIAKFFGF